LGGTLYFVALCLTAITLEASAVSGSRLVFPAEFDQWMHVVEMRASGSAEHVAEAVRLLRDSSVRSEIWHVRIEAVRYLQDMGPRAAAAVPALISTLEDLDPHLRQESARALGQIGASAKRAVPALEAAAESSDPTLREAARTALERINGSETAP
jgi:hypothetical protein